MMDVSGPRRSLARRQINRAQAEPDQHQRDRELEGVGRAHGHLRAQDHENGPHRDQRERVAEPPADAEKRRLVAAALAGDERRYRGKMIRFERVPHAEQRAKARAGHEFEYWHGDGRSF